MMRNVLTYYFAYLDLRNTANPVLKNGKIITYV